MKTLSLCLIICLVGCDQPTHLPPSNSQNNIPKQVQAKQEEVKQEVQQEAKQEEVKKEQKEVNRITLTNFYRIKDGMTYEEVERILGPATEEMASSGPIHMLSWQVRDGWGANMNITFEYGRVSAKAQLGLPNGEPTPDYVTEADLAKQQRQAFAEQQRQAKAEHKAKVIQVNKEKAEETRKLSTRNWTDVSGSFSTEAQYLYIIKDLVYLKKTSDGKVIKVLLDKLSTEDKQWIDDWKKRKPANTE